MGAVAGECPVLRLRRTYTGPLHIRVIVFRMDTVNPIVQIGAIPTRVGVTGVTAKDEWLQVRTVAFNLSKRAEEEGHELDYPNTRGNLHRIGNQRLSSC
jgi:hypothetical protein